MVLDYLNTRTGNPCVVLPGGAGKSVCIADLCRHLPDKNILMLTHVRELIEQNENKLLALWPDAPVGVYSAGLKRKEIERVTFAGIQSIGRRADLLGNIDICIVDECDLISHKDEGMYRKIIAALGCRVVGYTATPYRLGHGLITDKPAIFDDILRPGRSSLVDLINDGYLSRLISKSTPQKINVSGVGKRGGEYIESELQKAVDKSDVNAAIVSQVIERAAGRQHWLFFCAGVKHAENMRDELRRHGVTAETLSADTPSAERERIINDFKAGRITALTNNNILTVGFDYPDIDLIVHCRPTMSPRLYEQMNFRGTRLKSHIDNCLVLDFAGVVFMHGPMTEVRTPVKAGSKTGIAPSKECPECFEIIAVQRKACPECGYVFPIKTKRDNSLRNDDIMTGADVREMVVDSMKIREHISHKTGSRSLRVSYYPKIGSPIDEYLCVWHGGFIGRKGRAIYGELKRRGVKPDIIRYRKNGQFFDVIDRIWVDKKNDGDTVAV